MLTRRSLVLLGVPAGLGVLLAACSSDDNKGSSGSISKLKVGLVTDVGKVDDKSFNQSAWDGVQQTKKDQGADVKFIETTDPKDYAKNIEQFAGGGYNVIVTVGFGLAEATVAAAKKYPNIKFIGVDQFQAPGQEVANLSGLVFDEDKSGFLAGALAAQISKSGTIGQVLGTDVVPPVVKFGKGYEAGAAYAKPGIKVLTWYHPGGLAKGFTDPEEGKKQALQMIAQNADIIFGAGGQTGTGALVGCAEKNVLCIGVDTDQYNTVPEAQKVLLSSAMKLISPGVVDLVKAAKGGQFTGGNYTGQVGLAPYHDQDKNVPDAVKTKMKDIDKGLKDGTIKTGVKV